MAATLPLSTRALRVGRWSLAASPRSILVCAALAGLVLAAAMSALLLGEIQVGLPRLLVTLAGDGSPFEDYLLLDSRIPRVLTGLLVGAALAMSGAIFQTVSRNPLGSPDIIGFETGAASGGLVALLVLGAGIAGTALGAVVGGMVAAAIVLGLATRGGLDSLRLVLVGVGMGAMLLAFNSMLIVQADIYDAQSAGAWLVGNLNGTSWTEVRWVGPAVLVGGTAALLHSRVLQMFELSDTHAAGLGLRTGEARPGRSRSSRSADRR